jgi:hypothetical protein
MQRVSLSLDERGRSRIYATRGTVYAHRVSLRFALAIAGLGELIAATSSRAHTARAALIGLNESRLPNFHVARAQCVED